MAWTGRIAALRKARGMTQEQLAERLGVTRQAVAKWEGELGCPDIDSLLALSDCLGVSLDALLRGAQMECLGKCPDEGRCAASDWIPFLLRAKRATYAAGGGQAPASRPQSHDLRYEEGNLLYIDTYLGGERFVGEEAVWRDGQPVWSMNYAGRVVEEGFSGPFLKAALMRVPEEMPFRGPALYREGEMTYHCSAQGDWRWFHGREEIFLCGRMNYECRFHGGVII